MNLPRGSYTVQCSERWRVSIGNVHKADDIVLEARGDAIKLRELIAKALQDKERRR